MHFVLCTGYDDKVKRMLSKANLPPVKDASELEALIEKTRAKIEKAKASGENRNSSTKEEHKGLFHILKNGVLSW